MKPLAHALTDLRGRFVSVDHDFCELIRRERCDILGKTILDLTAENDRPLNEKKLNDLREGGASFIIRKTYLTGDGGTQAVQNSVSLVTDGLGGSMVAASVTALQECGAEQYSRLVKIAQFLLDEQTGRALFFGPFDDQDWKLLLAAYLLEMNGGAAWAREISEAAGGDRAANVLRVWELASAGVLTVDGRAKSIEETSLRLSSSHLKQIERYLSGLDVAIR